MYNATLSRIAPRGSYVNPFDVFNQAFNQFLRSGEPEAQESTRTWAPAVDIFETTEAYVVKAELPGIPKEDVHITVENNVLTLKGERRFEKDETKENYHRIERTYGAFARSFTLPTRVDHEDVQAKFDNGVLTITVPKAAEAKPKKIEIG
jgi:HSP20 family protein